MIQRKLISKTRQGETFICSDGSVLFKDRYGNIRSKSAPLDKYGYKFCRIIPIGQTKRKEFSVHRLVALAFIPNTENKPTVNHINGNKLDNDISNLEWNTFEENNNHALVNNLMYNVKIYKINIHTKEIVDFYLSKKEALAKNKYNLYSSLAGRKIDGNYIFITEDEYNSGKDYITKRTKKYKNLNFGKRKISKEQALDIIKLLDEKILQADICKKYKINRKVVYKIKNGKYF